MLYTIAVILLALWLIGVVVSYTFGGLLHLLLLGAAIAFIVQLIIEKKSL
jgi:hypothetical protein